MVNLSSHQDLVNGKSETSQLVTEVGHDTRSDRGLHTGTPLLSSACRRGHRSQGTLLSSKNSWYVRQIVQNDGLVALQWGALRLQIG